MWAKTVIVGSLPPRALTEPAPGNGAAQPPAGSALTSLHIHDFLQLGYCIFGVTTFTGTAEVRMSRRILRSVRSGESWLTLRKTWSFRCLNVPEDLVANGNGSVVREAALCARAAPFAQRARVRG